MPTPPLPRGLRPQPKRRPAGGGRTSRPSSVTSHHRRRRKELDAQATPAIANGSGGDAAYAPGLAPTRFNDNGPDGWVEPGIAAAPAAPPPVVPDGAASGVVVRTSMMAAASAHRYIGPDVPRPHFPVLIRVRPGRSCLIEAQAEGVADGVEQHPDVLLRLELRHGSAQGDCLGDRRV